MRHFGSRIIVLYAHIVKIHIYSYSAREYACVCLGMSNVYPCNAHAHIMAMAAFNIDLNNYIGCFTW